jgi:hypothetical protein
VIVAAQCRAGRGLIGWSVNRLSEEAHVAKDEIVGFENEALGTERTMVEALQLALEQGGVQFMPEGKLRGAGVRLKFSRLIVKRIDVWENEGGSAAEDDV